MVPEFLSALCEQYLVFPPGTTCACSSDRTSWRGACPAPSPPWRCWAPTRSSPSWATTIPTCTAPTTSANLNWPQTRQRSSKRRLWSSIRHTGKVQRLEQPEIMEIMGLSGILPTSVVSFWVPAAPVFMLATEALAVRRELSATENIGYLQNVCCFKVVTKSFSKPKFLLRKGNIMFLASRCKICQLLFFNSVAMQVSFISCEDVKFSCFNLALCSVLYISTLGCM